MKYCELPKENLLVKFPNFVFQGEKKLNVVIAGGSVRDSLFGEKYNDIDIFGLNKSDLDEFVKLNLTKGKGYRLVYFNENLRTYRKGKTKVQIVYRDYDSFESILDSFDFTVCQFMYDGEKVLCGPSSLLDVHHKRIIINHLNPLYVFDTMRRVQKYVQRGYSICNGGIKDILDKCRGLSQEEYDKNVEFYPNTEEYRIIRFD